MLIVSLSDFSQNIGAYMKDAEGEEVIISKNQEPWIKLINEPVEQDPWGECLRLLDESDDTELPRDFPRFTIFRNVDL